MFEKDGPRCSCTCIYDLTCPIHVLVVEVVWKMYSNCDEIATTSGTVEQGGMHVPPNIFKIIKI